MKMKEDEIAACRAGLDPPFDYGGSRSALRLLAMYIAAKEPLPAPSKAEAGVEMPPLSAVGMAKTALYDAMREQGVGRAELARRLRWHLPQVSRLLDLRHASRMEHVEAALAALGLRLIIDVARAA